MRFILVLPFVIPLRILRRRFAVRLRESWKAPGRRYGEGVHYLDLMTELVAKVEEVQEALLRPQLQLTQRNLICGRRLRVISKRSADLGQAVPGLAAEEERIEVIVVPVEGALNGEVQVLQRLVIQDLDNPPDAPIPL